MKTLKYKSRGQSVYLLEELLTNLGYKVRTSTYFGLDTLKAVIDFQKGNRLVVDGIVGPKTWSKVIEKEQKLVAFNDKFLSEDDMVDFASKYELELAAVKAVNEVESRGNRSKKNLNLD